MDEADRAFMESIVPDGCLSIGFIAVATWIDEEGVTRWQLYNTTELPTSQCIGLLQLAQHQMMTPDEDDDE